MCSFLFCLKESVEWTTLLNLSFCCFFWFKGEIIHYQKLWTSLESREKHALRVTNSFLQFILNESNDKFSQSKHNIIMQPNYDLIVTKLHPGTLIDGIFCKYWNTWKHWCRSGSNICLIKRLSKNLYKGVINKLPKCTCHLL